jgi:hypothetical protein
MKDEGDGLGAGRGGGGGGGAQAKWGKCGREKNRR